MHILITGSAGFLGDHITRKLQSRGCTVTGCDINKIPEHSPDYFIHLPAGALGASMVGDIDWIFHAADIPDPSVYMGKPDSVIEEGIRSTLNIFRLAMETGAGVVLFSTSEIYGDAGFMSENDLCLSNPTQIRHAYAGKKQMDECLAAIYREKGIPVRIARIFNSYGPGLRDNRAVSAIIRAIRNDRPVTIHGDGQHIRSYCYVDDTVDGILKLVNSDYDLPVNIGNDQQLITFCDLIGIVETLMGKPAIRHYVEDLPGNVHIRVPDTRLARKILDWKPKTSLEEGLAATVASWDRQMV